MNSGCHAAIRSWVSGMYWQSGVRRDVVVNRHRDCHHDWSNSMANGPKLLVHITDTWPNGAVREVGKSFES